MDVRFYALLMCFLMQRSLGNEMTTEANVVSREISPRMRYVVPKTRITVGELNNRVQMSCNASIGDAKWTTPRFKDIKCTNSECSGDCQNTMSPICGYKAKESDGHHDLIIDHTLAKDFGIWSCVSQTEPEMVYTKYAIVLSSVEFEVQTSGLKIGDRIAANCSYNASIPFKMVSSLLDDSSTSEMEPSDVKNSTENGFLFKVTSSDYYTLNERHFGKDVQCQITFPGDYLETKIVTGSQTLRFDIPPHISKATDASTGSNEAVLYITSFPFPDTFDIVVLNEGSPVQLPQNPQIKKESPQRGNITLKFPEALNSWDVMIKTRSGELDTKVIFPSKYIDGEGTSLWWIGVIVALVILVVIVVVVLRARKKHQRSRANAST